MDDVDDGWQRVATAVRARREHLGLRREDMTASPSTVYKLETAAKTSYKSFALRKVEADLAWAPGAIDRILSGEDPVEDDGFKRQVEIQFAALEKRLNLIEKQLAEIALLRAGDE